MIQDLKRRSAQAVEQYHAILDEEEARQAVPSAKQAASSARPYSLVILGQLLLDASLTPAERKRLAKTPGLSVLIESPTAEWVRPLHRAIGYVGPWVHHEMRDGTPRNRRKTTVRLAVRFAWPLCVQRSLTRAAVRLSKADKYFARRSAGDAPLQVILGPWETSPERA